MKYTLYRDNPFRPLFANGEGFSEPTQDEERPLWIFSSEAAAALIRAALRPEGERGFVFVAKLTYIKERMKNYVPS